MKLAHTMIRVRDLERSLDFYSNFLGLHEVRRKAMQSLYFSLTRTDITLLN